MRKFRVGDEFTGVVIVDTQVFMPIETMTGEEVVMPIGWMHEPHANPVNDVFIAKNAAVKFVAESDDTMYFDFMVPAIRDKS